MLAPLLFLYSNTHMKGLDIMASKEKIQMVCWVLAIVLFADLAVTFPVLKELRELRAEIEGMRVLKEQLPTTEEARETKIVEETPAEEMAQPAHPVHFDIPLSNELQDRIFDICEAYEIEPELVIAMIGKESAYNASVVGDRGRSIGLMQVQPRWHKDRMERLGCLDLLDPVGNVNVAVDYLAELLRKGKGLEWALMAYNGGPNYANEMVYEGLVSDYVREILANKEKLGVRV